MWKIIVNSICIGSTGIGLMIAFGGGHITLGVFDTFAFFINIGAMVANYIVLKEKEAQHIQLLADMDNLLMNHTPLDKMHHDVANRIRQAHIEYLRLGHEKQSRISF